MSGKRWRWFKGFGLVEVDIVTGLPFADFGSNEPKKNQAPGMIIRETVTAPDGTKLRSQADHAAFLRNTGQTNELDSIREQRGREMDRANNPMKARDPNRKAQINDAIERASSSGYSRRAEYE